MHWMEAITWAKCVYSEGDNAAQIMLEDISLQALKLKYFCYEWARFFKYNFRTENSLQRSSCEMKLLAAIG